MAATTIAGKDVVVFKRTSTSPDVWKAIVCATDASLSISKEVIESKTKCGTTRKPGVQSWDMTISGVVNTTPETTEISQAEIFTDLDGDTLGHYAFKDAADTFGYEGDAYVTKLDFSSGADGFLTFNATFSGQGDIEAI